MMKIILAFTYLLCFPFIAHAEQAITGKKFVEICARNNQELACKTILLSSIKRVEKTEVDNKKIICFPDSVGPAEEMIVVRNFIRASPSYLHLSLDILSLGALQAAFSCN